MKKIDIFKELKQILARLKPFEAEVALNYLLAFERKNEGNKSHRALEMLLNEKSITYNDLKQAVSPDVDKYSFNKFLIRLRNKIFDSLTIDLNITRKHSYSDWFKAQQQCTKEWILIKNLIGRGNELSARQLLDENIQKCIKFELYDILSALLVIHRERQGLSSGQKAFDTIQQQFENAERCRQAVNKAFEWNTRFYMVADRKSSQNEQVGILTEALSELHELYKQTNAAIVGEYVHYFEMEYHQAMHDYAAVKESGEALVKLIETRPALRSDIKLSNAYANIAFNDLLMHELDDALKHIDCAFKGSGLGSYNYMVITTLKAQVLYFKGDFKNAWEIADTMLQSDLAGIAPFERSKLVYLCGCILFNQKAYQKAYEYFSSDVVLMDTDPEGWNVGVRIMSILCLIEMQLDELADLSIESFRKHMSRTNDERNFKTRDKAILKILRSLERNSFDFGKTYFKHQDLFYLLQSNDPEYAWRIKSHEHLVFHDWFMAKLAQKDYEFALPEIIELMPVDKNEKR